MNKLSSDINFRNELNNNFDKLVWMTQNLDVYSYTEIMESAITAVMSSNNDATLISNMITKIEKVDVRDAITSAIESVRRFIDTQANVPDAINIIMLDYIKRCEYTLTEL